MIPGLAAEALPAGEVLPGATALETGLEGGYHVLELFDLEFVIQAFPADLVHTPSPSGPGTLPSRP